MAKKEGNSILVRVAKLLRLSIYFDNMVSQIYPSEPQLNKAN